MRRAGERVGWRLMRLLRHHDLSPPWLAAARLYRWGKYGRPRYAYGRIGWWRDEDEIGRTHWRWYARLRGLNFGLREGYWKVLDDETPKGHL